MNSVQRVTAAVRFARPDRTPVIPQIFGHAATFCGVPLRDYCLDGKTLAECQLKALAFYGYDAVFAITGVGVEAEALGAQLEYRDQLYPFVRSYPFSALTNLSGIKIPDPARAGRMPQVVQSLQLMRREVGDEALVVGCVLGPTTLAAQLMGLEPALFLAADQPDDFENLLDFCVTVLTVYGKAQLDAGAHLVLIFDPCASTEVVPPQFFREMEMPRLREMFDRFNRSGALAAWLHVAGKAEEILRYYPQAGVEIANFDYDTSPATLQDLLPGVCANGNLKSLSFIEDAPATVGKAAQELLEDFSRRGGFILSSGCEIPPEAKVKNIQAMVAAALKENNVG
ncbi:MAG: uroporphyrinogen decarboxylase family protein [Negativicutes bacterium]|nr:uroporphyrinogen decarboxylase family protein [Negativicutes bacterium]